MAKLVKDGQSSIVDPKAVGGRNILKESDKNNLKTVLKRQRREDSHYARFTSAKATEYFEKGKFCYKRNIIDI